MDSVQVATDSYTEVLAYHDGSTLLEFTQAINPPVHDVTDVELVAYDLPCRKETIDSSNDSIDFSVGPFISQCHVLAHGKGYDMFNPPNLHLTHFRSYVGKHNERIPSDHQSPGWYPPFGVRNCSGLGLTHVTDGAMSPAVDHRVWHESVSQKPLISKLDTLQMCASITDTSIASVDVYMRGSHFDVASTRVTVDKPFEYPYSIYISQENGTPAYLFNDVIKIYRAFYRYEASGSNDISFLGTQIAMEINYSLGWDVRHELNDNLCPEDSESRWHPDNRGQFLQIAGTWDQDPRQTPRYMCVFQSYGNVSSPRFSFVDTLNQSFHLGKRLNGAVPPPVAWDNKVRHSNGDVQASTGYREHFISGSTEADGTLPVVGASHRQACITTLWGLLGFISPISTKHVLPGGGGTIPNFPLPGRGNTVVKGFQSLVNAVSNLQAYYKMYKTRTAASLQLDILRCTARLRHGVYSIGTVMEQSYKRPAQNSVANKPSRHIHTRQASDGLIKEVQDQMNIAIQGYRIARELGNTSDMASSYDGSAWRLHVPHLGQQGSPHVIVVSLENNDIEQPDKVQSHANLRTNQSRKSRVRISLSDMYSGARPQADKNNLTLTLLFESGPNAARSAGSMLGFENKDRKDSAFTVFAPTDLSATTPSYGPFVPYTVYGIQAHSRWDTGVKSKACVHEFGINTRQYEKLAVAMVAGRTEFANNPSNADGSVQSFINETTRLSGFNRPTEVGTDTTKASVFTEAALTPAINPFVRPIMQDNPNVPVFRAIDWGARKMRLDRRTSVERIYIRGLDGRSGQVWPCNASESAFVMIRLHHSRESKDMFRRQT